MSVHTGVVLHNTLRLCSESLTPSPSSERVIMDASTSAHTLDDAIVTNDGPLYYPPATESSTLPQEISPAEPRLLRDRIYVGNLHPSVDEYATIVLQISTQVTYRTGMPWYKSSPSSAKSPNWTSFSTKPVH